MGCMQETLRLLPKETLISISGMAVSASTALKGIKLKKQALASSLDINLIPLQAKKALLDVVIGDVREKTRVIPTDLALRCPELGNVNTMLEQALVPPVEGFIDAAFEVDRMLSLKSEIGASLQEIDAAIDFFDQLVSDIGNIIGQV